VTYFYSGNTIITDDKHLYNVLDTLPHVQQYLNLRNFYGCFYAHPVYTMGSHNV